MAEQIAGPGIGNGGPSEIAAVSVGVYVIDRTGDGFTAVKADMAVKASVLQDAAATTMTEVGKTGGEALAKGVEEKGIGKAGGSAGILGGLRSARKSFTQGILGLFAVPFVISEAFNFGTKIGEAIWGPVKADGLRTMEDIQKVIAQSRSNVTDRGNAARPDAPKLDDGLNAVREMMKLEQARNEEMRSHVRSERAALETSERQDLVLDAIALKESQIAESNRIIAEYKKQIEGITGRVANDEDRINNAKKEQLLREKMLKTESAVLSERTSSDIGRMRQLLELSVRQRFPTTPGGSVTYSNQGAVR